MLLDVTNSVMFLTLMMFVFLSKNANKVIRQTRGNLSSIKKRFPTQKWEIVDQTTQYLQTC